MEEKVRDEVINEAKEEKKVQELNSKISTYTDAEKECVKEDIEKFEKDPLGCGIEINTIVGSICTSIVEATKEKLARTNEQNSIDTEDIFGSMLETNSKENEDSIF